MLNFLTTLFKGLLSFLNNDVYLNLIGVIFTAVLSYNAAKYSASKPNKTKIRQQQFDNVYLPLFRLLQNIPETPTKLQALALQKKISNILNKNYALVFPQLHSLNNEFQNCLLHDGNFVKVLKSIKHQVHVDYELLKKQLGYPSENFYKIFIRMTFKQKAQFIISWANVISFVFVWLLAIKQMMTFKGDVILMGMLLFVEILIYIAVMLKINKIIDNLND